MAKKRVVVFGIFDGVHDGHRDLFKQAREFGDNLIVIVGRDSVAEKLKGKKLKYTQDERVDTLNKEELVTNAVLGDKELSSYKVLEQLHPDVICLGYDQANLETDLRKWLALRPFDTGQGKPASLPEGRESREQGKKSINLYVAKPYMKDALHNSIL